MRNIFPGTSVSPPLTRVYAVKMLQNFSKIQIDIVKSLHWKKSFIQFYRTILWVTDTSDSWTQCCTIFKTFSKSCVSKIFSYRDTWTPDFGSWDLDARIHVIRVGWGGMGIAGQMSHLIFSYAMHFFVTVLCTNNI